MELHGKIRNFSTYTDEQLEQMRKDLSIAMPVSFLRHCAKYYKSNAKRDPAIDELKMLDCLACAVQLSPASIAPIELQTNDAFVANTYADMMEKRYALKPDTKAPMAFGEAFELANAYLSRAGRKVELPGTPVFSEVVDSSPFSIAQNCIGSTHGIQLRLLSSCPVPNRSDDLLALLLPVANRTSSTKAAACALDRMINDPVVSSLVKKITPLSHGGLLSAILTEAGGAWIDLKRLSQSEEPLPLSALITAFENGYFLRIPRENEEKLFHIAKERGVRALIFATMTTKDKIIFHRSQKESFAIDTSFLRSLCTLRPVKLRLQNEADGALKKANCAPILPQSCAYIKAEKEELPSPIAKMGELCASPASAELRDAVYLNALYTALLPVLHQSLAGNAYSEQKLAVSLQLPPSGTADAAGASAILGLYRLQAELGITITPSLREKATATAPVLTAFSVAKKSALSSVLLGEGNPIYLFKPKIQENRLPDFESLRRLLDRLCSMQRNGIIVSAYVLCNESPEQGLKQMENKETYCNLKNGRLLTEPALELAILVEAGCLLADLEPIGTVAQRQKAPVCELPLPQLTPIQSLIRSEEPEITLVAMQGDAHANMLAAVLNQTGASVRLFVSSKANEIALCRALLTSQTLILCGNATLAKTPEIEFAYQTLLRAGGRVLYVGQRTEKPEGNFFPCGFSTADLRVLCDKNGTDGDNSTEAPEEK